MAALFARHMNPALVSELFADGILVCQSTRPGGTPCVVAVPASRYEILDTWHSSSLRGSGSQDIVIESTLVDRDEVFTFDKVRTANTVIDRMPVMASIASVYAAQTQ